MFKPTPSARILIGPVLLAVLAVGVPRASAQDAHPPGREIFDPEIELVFEHITVDDGLPENSVRAILQDSSGFLWFGTMNGLVRYDGYEMKVFAPSATDTSSFGGRTVLALHEDDKGDIWIGTYLRGLWKYDPRRGTFSSVPLGRADITLADSERVNDINQDAEGRLWVAMMRGLVSIEPGTGEVVWHDAVAPLETGGSKVLGLTRVYPDDRGRLWVATEHNGVMIYDPESGSVRNLVHHPDRPRSLPSMTSYDVLQTPDGKIWLTTTDGICLWQEATGDFITYRAPGSVEHANLNLMVRLQVDDEGLLWIGSATGLYVFDPARHVFRLFSHDFEIPTSPVNGPVLSLMFDRSGILWAGSWHAGLNKVNPRTGGFRTQTFGAGRQAAGGLSVDGIFEDSGGGLWIGTGDAPAGVGNGGLFYRAAPGEPFAQIAPGPDQPSIPSVRGIFQDPDGVIWVLTYRGIWALENGRLGRKTLGSGPESDLLAISNIKDLVIDAEGSYWIATWSGLFRWDSRTDRLTQFRHMMLDPHSISSNELISLHLDHAGRLWIGSDSRGLNLFRSEDQGFQRFFSPEQGLETVSEIVETSNGDLWLASFSGLVRFDPATGSADVYGRDQGLPNDQVVSIQPDDSGRFWLSTGYGLARFDPESHQVKSFDVLDGLPDNEVKFASLKDSRGLIHFGGRTGLVTFDPAGFERSRFRPRVAITGIALADTLLQPGPDSPLKQMSHLADRIELDHDQNHLALSFASLDFARPDQNRYRYMLDGLDPGWRTPVGERRATYTNLSPGTYNFRVGGTNRDGEWSDHEASLVIRINPPWWHTWWAYVLYVAAVLAVVATILRQIVVRERMRSKLDLQRAEAAKLQELDELKSRFLTNITHEFRTPLTLIKTPLLSIKSEHGDKVDERVTTMIRNADRLEHLIDQLLDLSRLEAGRLPIHWQVGDCWGFMREFLRGFESVAAQRQIRLKTEIPAGSCPVWFDEDLGEKLIGNLVSNAIKYSPDAGRVTVGASISDAVVPVPVPRFGRRAALASTAPARWVTVTVANSGSYIPPHERDRIFDRFYQITTGGGSGVGLALVKELTEWLGGSIEVLSSPVTGTVFTAVLPVFEHHPEEGPASPGPDQSDESEAPATAAPDHEEESSPEDDEPRILVVEDHAELRHFIREDFSPEYRVLVAEDGQQGLDVAVAEIPDLVLSDIMMPVMDGLELCRRLKEDERTSHIPVILLTSKSDAESRHQGLRLGADDYVAKPFDGEDLRLRINNLIGQRRKLAGVYERRLAVLAPDVMPVTSADERFVALLRSVIDSNLEDPDFKINALCHEVGMSRSQLHRKLKAVTGKSTSDFVRSHRIQRAAQLFNGGYGNVTEVAYAVGFRNLSYFSRSFKEVFDLQPSEYLKNVSQQEPTED